MQKNIDVRRTAAASGIKLWQIADQLHITDSYFSRKLRHKLPDEEKQKIFAIIEDLAKEVG